MKVFQELNFRNKRTYRFFIEHPKNLENGEEFVYKETKLPIDRIDSEGNAWLKEINFSLLSPLTRYERMLEEEGWSKLK